VLNQGTARCSNLGGNFGARLAIAHQRVGNIDVAEDRSSGLVGWLLIEHHVVTRPRRGRTEHNSRAGGGSGK
jgi:hypothetical protein